MDSNILEEPASIFRVDHEDAGSVFLINIGVHLPHYMVSQPEVHNVNTHHYKILRFYICVSF
jgi:hypothetical protein